MTDAEVIDSMLDRLSGGKGATPRPWALEPEGAWIYAPECSDPGDCVCDMPSEGDFSRARWIANAALIVKAVNAYDDMLAALRDVEAALLHDAAPPFDPRNENRIYQLDGGILGNALNKVRGAIARAEGAAP